MVGARAAQATTRAGSAPPHLQLSPPDIEGLIEALEQTLEELVPIDEGADEEEEGEEAEPERPARRSRGSRRQQQEDEE